MTRWTNHLAVLRKRAGFTQEQLAHALSEPTTKGTISQYETGSRNMSIERLYEIASILKCSAGEILDGPRAAPASSLSLLTEDALVAMIEAAMRELPVGVTFEDYPAAVAASLRAQIEQFAASSEIDHPAPRETLAGQGEQFHSPTN